MFSRSKLGVKLVLASLLVSSILSAIATGVQLYASYERQKNQTLLSLDRVEVALAISLSESLWKFDFQQVDLILDGLMSNVALASLHLTSTTGHEWMRGETAQNITSRSYPLIRQHRDGSREHVGELEVAISLDEVIDIVWAQFWALLLSNLIKAYVSAFALLFLFQRLVTRHLLRLADSVEASWPLGQEPEADERSLEPRETDEIQLISQAITHYQMRVDQTLSQLQTEIQSRTRAEEEATKALSIRTKFLGTMSHEVRTPLNSMLGFFHLIENADDVPEIYQNYAHVGTQAGHQLLNQLANVLEMARLDSHTVESSPRATPIFPITKLWVENTRASVALAGKDINVTMEISPRCPDSVMIDGAKVTQVVSNLTSNAVKFTELGEIQIAVDWDPEEGLEICVSDTGIGIPEDSRHKIFERFVQLDSDMTREHGGSGLGLAICAELCSVMGATLKLRKNMNTRFATTFVLELHQKCRLPSHDNAN